MFPQWKPSKEIFIEIKQESPDLIIELQMRNPSGSLYSMVNHLMQRSSNYNNNNKAKSQLFGVGNMDLLLPLRYIKNHMFN